MAEKRPPAPTPKPVRANIPAQTKAKVTPKSTTSKTNIPLESKVVIRPVDHQEGQNALYPPNQTAHLPYIPTAPHKHPQNPPNPPNPPNPHNPMNPPDPPQPHQLNWFYFKPVFR